MTRSEAEFHFIHLQRLIMLLAAGVLFALAIRLLFGAIARGQANAREAGSQEITPSFGDGKLKILGAGFKPNESVVIAVKLDRGAVTFSATANKDGAFQLAPGLALAPGSSVELDARGNQGSGSASITTVPPTLPLPQTGAEMPSFGATLLAGLLLLGGALLATRRVSA